MPRSSERPEPMEPFNASSGSGPAPRWTWLLTLGVLGTAVALRFGAVVGGGLASHMDNVIYLNHGVAILRGMPFSLFPNGYPLIVAGVQAITGQEIPLNWLLGLNAVASVATVLLAYVLGRRAGGLWVGLAAAAVLAVFPNQILHTRMTLSEPVAAALLLGGLYALTRARPAAALCAGLLLGYACATRTTLLPALPLLALVVIVFRRAWREAALLGVGATVIWMGFAGLAGAGVIKPADNLGYNLLVATRSVSHEGVQFGQTKTTFTEAEELAPLKTYLKHARDQPVHFLRQRASALWEMWGPWPYEGDERYPRRWWARLLLGLRALIIVPAVWSLWRYRHLEIAWLLAVPLLTVTVVHTMFFSVSRFSVLVEPLATVLAAWALVGWWTTRYRSATDAT